MSVKVIGGKVDRTRRAKEPVIIDVGDEFAVVRAAAPKPVQADSGWMSCGYRAYRVVGPFGIEVWPHGTWGIYRDGQVIAHGEGGFDVARASAVQLLDPIDPVLAERVNATRTEFSEETRRTLQFNIFKSMFSHVFGREPGHDEKP